MIEKVVVGEFQKRGECNYGRQQIDFYITNIGCVSELVDVRYRTYSKRVEEAIPKLWKNGRVSIQDICDELEITYGVLKKALKHEDKIFLEVLFDMKKKTILECVDHGNSIDEVCTILDIPVVERLNAFCRQNLGMSYRKLLKNRK